MRQRQRTQRDGGSHKRRGIWRLALPVVLGLLLALVGLLPAGPGRALIPVASAHALLIRSDPAADAILQTPPTHVHLFYDEDLNPLTSRVQVVDTANREVDNKDSSVNAGNSKEMDATLPLEPAGTYIVVWRAQSADDGHVTGGSFIFRIARPDGTVPPIPANLPTGHIVGGGGSGATGSSSLDGPTLLLAVSTFLALLFMTFWVGGLIWETWILAPNSSRDPDLAAAASAASRRFRRLAPYALGLVLVTDIGIVLAQGAQLAGDWSGLFAPQLLRAILFGSHFGTYWWMREVIAGAALALTLVAARRGWPIRRPDAAIEPEPVDAVGPSDAIPDWRREVLIVLRDVRHLPRRIVTGWQRHTWLGHAECILGAALLVAFALSGHAAAGGDGLLGRDYAYTIGVDLLHLLFQAAWLGGLFYISVVLVPALAKLAPRQRARILALGLPEFSAVAIVSAVVLAATGSLNTTIRLTSLQQFLTTAYGRTLAVKIEFFLFMVAISAYHAFILRPRLAQALREQASPAARPLAVEQRWSALVSATTMTDAIPSQKVQTTEAAPAAGHDAAGFTPPTSRARTLAERLEDWLVREALIGVAVLGCVALLGAFAGSLATPPIAAKAPTTGVFLQTQQVSGDAITLKVTPATFGTNTFIVSVKDAQGNPITNAHVKVETVMLDMDMGTQLIDLAPMGNTAPGSYSGTGDLTMAGHWKIVAQVRLNLTDPPLQAEYHFVATY